MKKLLITGVLLVAVAAGIVWLIGRQGGGEATDKLRVSATYYPLYEFARQVGGDKVEVANMTPAGAEPHDYEPSPQAVAQAERAAVFVYNGGHMEPWTDNFVKDYPHVAVKASAGIQLQTAADEDDPTEQVQDPHFWLDPVLARQIVYNIRDGLAKADPNNKTYYTQRADAYVQQLAQLDNDFRSGLATCQTRTIVTSHAAFGYLGKRYNLEVLAIAGLSPDEEPSAGKLAELTELVRDRGLQYIFFEQLASPRLADTIAAETGAHTLVFDPIEGLTNEAQQQGKNYISVQRDNLANLRTALACQ